MNMNEEEMREIVEKMGKIPGMPRAMFLKIQYNEELQKITDKAEHPMVMSEGGNFAYLLQNIFIEYPKIQKKYPPGALGFTINGTPPKPHTPLFDGDVVVFSVAPK